jgi:hypothetical protein
MNKIDLIKEGDLIVRRQNKKPHIVLQIKNVSRTVYGSKGAGEARKNFLLLLPNGRQKWTLDTTLKTQFYLPGDPWFDDIR